MFGKNCWYHHKWAPGQQPMSAQIVVMWQEEDQSDASEAIAGQDLRFSSVFVLVNAATKSVLTLTGQS